MRTLALGILILAGCSGGGPAPRAGTIREVRVEKRETAWGVGVAKRQVEVKAVQLVIELDCGGRTVFFAGESEGWALAKPGDRVILSWGDGGIDRWVCRDEMPECPK